MIDALHGIFYDQEDNFSYYLFFSNHSASYSAFFVIGSIFPFFLFLLLPFFYILPHNKSTFTCTCREQPLHMTIYTYLTSYAHCSQEFSSLTLVLTHTYQLCFLPRSVLSFPLVSSKTTASPTTIPLTDILTYMLSPILHAK
jgi:hypothetical protein